MPRNNSYAQGGLHNPQNPHFINGQGWNANASRPPTFGALPAFTSSSPTYLVFEFANVLNYGEPVAGVGLQSQTSGLEVVNIVNQQATSLWLQPSSDLSYQITTFGGRQYAWVPHGGGSIVLSTTGSGPPEQLIRIDQASNIVVIEVTREAVAQHGSRIWGWRRRREFVFVTC